MTCVTNGVSQGDETVARAASDLQYLLSKRGPERLNTKITDGVFARIGNEIVDTADPIVEVLRVRAFHVFV
jgi:hypothetical protein